MTTVEACLVREYLNGYIALQGSSVKVIAGPAAGIPGFKDALSSDSNESGYITISLSAETDKLHLIQNMFFGIARQLDWNRYAKIHAYKVLERLGLEYPRGATSTLRTVAEINQLEPHRLSALLERRYREDVLHNPNYSRTFKAVLLALISGVIDSSGPAGALSSQVIEWLCGRVADGRMLKKLNITRRINRQNARGFVLDTARWLRDLGAKGLVVIADVAAYARFSGLNGGNRYGPSAALDLYEMMRQFIDGIEDAPSLFMVFCTGQEFLTDRRRGMAGYEALRMRLVDDVYDSKMPNLMAPLVLIS